MAKDYPRSDRVGDQVQQELAALIRTEVKDPRLSTLLTVTEVRLSHDLQHAKVYISSLDNRGEESVELLNSYKGRVRSLLGKRMRLRVVPDLHFIYDTLGEEGARISELIDRAVGKPRADDDTAQ
ncbi:MAG: 30S ribosome-binding factor RbfA [Gammaproteobacteria bacterium]|nr:30S ribosome-binding factor RbfA [Gammaproteobacteria bacterium]